eukprot:9214448-Lingulodinium_polyedra.AAC.1
MSSKLGPRCDWREALASVVLLGVPVQHQASKHSGNDLPDAVKGCNPKPLPVGPDRTEKQIKYMESAL